MICQIGIYANSDQSIDQWHTLIHLKSQASARDLLRTLTPFLREFHCNQGMEDSEGLSAWLTWHLIDSGLSAASDFTDISLNREINPGIDFFCRLTPGLVEIFRVDEVLDWHPLAATEITCEPVELEEPSYMDS